MKFRALYSYLIISSAFILGCGKHTTEIDIEHEIDVNIIRFEQYLSELDIYSVQDSIESVYRAYPDFFPLFTNKIIEIGNVTDPWIGEAFKQYLTDQAIFNLTGRVKEVFSDFSGIQKLVDEGFSRVSSVFEQAEVPDIYTYVSGFNQSIVVGEGIMGVSLDKYLGADEKIYNQVYPPIPQYMKYKMCPDKLPSDIINSWILTSFEAQPEQNNLLSNMLIQGRAVYLTELFLPGIADTLLWGFTPDQIRFCYDNERQMYTYLIEQKLLFSTDKFSTGQFMNDAPFTKDFTTDSPGRAAVWIGYRIIDSYMQKNPDVSLKQLMDENNFQRLLNGSRYRP